MANADPQLQRAYDLIEVGDLQSARNILTDIRSEHQNNPDYWWIFAHATEDEQAGRDALLRVRQLAPNYPGLSDLSTEVGMTSPPTMPMPAPPPDAPTTADVDEFYEDEEGVLYTTQQPANDGCNPLLIFGALATLAVLALVFFLMNLLGNDNDTDPSQVDSSATQVIVGEDVSTISAQSITSVPFETLEPSPTREVRATNAEATTANDTTDTTATDEDQMTVTPVMTRDLDENDETETASEQVTSDAVPLSERTARPTEESETTEAIATSIPPSATATTRPTEKATATPEPTATLPPFTELYDDLAAYGVPVDSIDITEVDGIGSAYVIPTCSALGPIATENIVNILDTIRESDEPLQEVEGVVFNINDCDSDSLLRTLAFDREAVTDYFADEIDRNTLLQSIRRLR